MTHESYCNNCANTLNTLYRFAYMTLGDQDAACELVMNACVWGRDRCECFQDEDAFKKALLRRMFCRLLWSKANYAPEQENATEDRKLLYLALGSLSRLRRAVLVLRFCTNVRHKTAQEISRLPNKLFLRLLTGSATQVSAVLKKAE